MEKDTLITEIEKALDKIRPYLNADGGDIDLIDVTDQMVVHVRLKGACQSCSMNLQTLKIGVERAIIGAIPQIKEVVAI